nr:hypothetical protein [Actinomyces bouchesdurhonensis]
MSASQTWSALRLRQGHDDQVAGGALDESRARTQVFKTWLASQPDTWRSRIEIVAMDGFTGFKSAAAGRV